LLIGAEELRLFDIQTKGVGSKEGADPGMHFSESPGAGCNYDGVVSIADGADAHRSVVKRVELSKRVAALGGGIGEEWIVE
jgi:hypothetical protein